MKQFGSHSIGMDLSDVNFEVTKDSSCRHADEQTFRELFELILDSINREPEFPHHMQMDDSLFTRESNQSNSFKK